MPDCLEHTKADTAALLEQVAELKHQLEMKDRDFAELSVRSQELLQENIQLRHNYELMSGWHDEAVQKKGAAMQKLKANQVQKTKEMNSLAEEWSCLYPAAAEAMMWLKEHRESLRPGQRVEIPVLCLRWTHDDINSKMMFGHGGKDDESILKLFDQLQRGNKQASQINAPLDVAQYSGKLCSLSNRRLTALMMYQGLHRDACVKAWCKIVSCGTEKFDDANSTQTDGLSIRVRNGESQHFGAPLFQRGEYALSQLADVSQRHPEAPDVSRLVTQLRIKRSVREPDGCSLTLTQASNA